MGLPGLDVVFSLDAGAVDVLVDGAAANPVEAGDDEARVSTLRPGLNPGDDEFDLIPACGAVVELLEATELLATSLGGARVSVDVSVSKLAASGGI